MQIYSSRTVLLRIGPKAPLLRLCFLKSDMRFWLMARRTTFMISLKTWRSIAMLLQISGRQSWNVIIVVRLGWLLLQLRLLYCLFSLCYLPYLLFFPFKLQCLYFTLRAKSIVILLWNLSFLLLVLYYYWLSLHTMQK